MAWRALKTMRRNPEQFFDVTLQPLLFTAMFAYVFGGAISGDVAKYLPLMIPGIVAQTVLTTCMATGVQLRSATYKTQPADGRIVRFEIVVPVSGSYGQIRDFLKRSTAEIPVMSVDQVTLKRQEKSSTLQAELRLTLHMVKS